MKILFIVLFIALLVLIGPLGLIWAVNTLASGSSFQIAYGFWEVLAALVLLMLMNAKQ